MSENLQAEATVIGAGVAGCCAAIALRRAGIDVLLLEKSSRRPHRFCGEFVSGEAATSLDDLGLYKEVMGCQPTRVRRMSLYGTGGRPYSLPLAEEGLGLSRRVMDSVLLAQAAKLGVRDQQGAFVESVSAAAGSRYEVTVSSESPRRRAVIRSRVVIGAQGKRSNLDRVLGRKFFVRRSPYVGVKCHFAGMDRGDNVELYLFPGGYCGVVGIEANRTNICLLAAEQALRQNGGRPEKLIGAARRENPFLAESMRDASAFEDSLLTIGQVSFIPREQIVNGVFMVGDSAGVMAPFLGVGVAGAMRSAVGLCGLGLPGDERETNPPVGAAQVRTLVAPASPGQPEVGTPRLPPVVPSNRWQDWGRSAESAPRGRCSYLSQDTIPRVLPLRGGK